MALADNKAKIQALLAGINALPEAGSGGGEDVSAETAEYTSLLTDLETAVDALPDAGGGGSMETCTVTFAIGDPIILSEACIVIYVGADGQAQSQQWIPGSTVITVIKGSHIVVVNWSAQGECTNANQLYFYNGSCGVYKIVADAMFTYYM